MAAILLALSASLIWGVGDFLGGLKSRQVSLLTVMVCSQVVGFFVILAVTLASGQPAPPGEDAVYAALSAVAGTAALASFFKAMQVGKMSVVVPLAATSAVVPVVVGIASGERPGSVQVAGMAIALIGVILASREPEPGEDEGRVSAGVGYAFIAALGFGCFFVAIDAASDGGAVWASMINRTTSVSMLILVALVVRPPLREARGHTPALAVIGTCDVMANVTFAAAFTKGLTSVVSVVGSLYPVVTVLLARIVLRERIHRIQEAGAAAALAGVALIAAG